jgi:hypothetical protein
MNTGDDKSDDDLFRMILEAEDESFAEGHDPKSRSLDVPSRVMRKLGYFGYVMTGPGVPQVFQRIRSIHRGLYRPRDVGAGALHGGFFAFRGIYCQFHIPIMFGTVAIDPFNLTDLTENQLNWLASRETDLNRFIAQFADVFDFAGGAYGLADYQVPPREAHELFYLAGFQLQAAAAALCAAYDVRGAIQSSLIGTELALKGGLLAAGANQADLKAIGHNRSKAADEFAKAYSSFNVDQVHAAMRVMPPYVENRYSAAQPNRFETGEIAMSAQFIAGEMMRAVAGISMITKMERVG